MNKLYKRYTKEELLKLKKEALDVVNYGYDAKFCLDIPNLVDEIIELRKKLNKN